MLLGSEMRRKNNISQTGVSLKKRILVINCGFSALADRIDAAWPSNI